MTYTLIPFMKRQKVTAEQLNQQLQAARDEAMVAASAAIAAVTADYLARITALTNGSPADLDTFLEVYNRFMTGDSAMAALTTTVAGKIATSQMGVANGVASLDSGGKVPSAQLPAGAATTWGSITGTLATQTDLASVLAAKAGAATTLAGYGIADAYTKTEQDARYLQADLSDFPSRLLDTAVVITDWNNANQNGWWMGSDAANSPAAGWFIGLVERHNAIYMTQTVHAFAAAAASDTQRYRRHCQNNTWTAWYRLRDSQTELDARYAPISATSEWVEILDTTISSAVAYVEQTWTAGTYAAIEAILSDVSGSANSATMNCGLRHSGGAIMSAQIGAGATNAADINTQRVYFTIGLNAATKNHQMWYPGVTGAVDAAVMYGNASNATAPDRCRFWFNTGNIDAGRIIIKALKA
jgi:hypothetical protein